MRAVRALFFITCAFSSIQAAPAACLPLFNGPVSDEACDSLINSTAPTVWLDASKLSTITHSSGAVSAWASRYGAISFAQSTAAAKPTLVVGPNGRPALSFDGGDYLESASTGSDAFAVAGKGAFVGFKATAITADAATSYSNDGLFSLASGNFGFYLKKTGALLQIENWDGNADVAQQAITLGKQYALVVGHDGTSVSQRLNAGTLVSAASGSTGGTGLGSALRVGRGTASLYLTGVVSDVILWNKVLPAQTLNAITRCKGRQRNIDPQ
jgi:hypothetical protein